MSDVQNDTEGSVILTDCVEISPETGLAPARSLLRQMLREIGLENEIMRTKLLTILDELGNNILRHGKLGGLCMSVVETDGRLGIRIISEDEGAGIADMEKAFQPGFSEDHGLGMGLNLLMALADDIKIANLLKGGTYIEVWKWI